MRNEFIEVGDRVKCVGGVWAGLVGCCGTVESIRREDGEAWVDFDNTPAVFLVKLNKLIRIEPSKTEKPIDTSDFAVNSDEMEPTGDPVNHPKHYTQGGIECIDAIRAALTADEFRGYCKGNAIKYIWRERYKGGDESIEKASWYLNKMLMPEVPNA